MTVTPRPPSYLKPATKRWFLDVLEEYELEEHHRRLLTIAAESWDMAADAREQLAKEGLTVETRHGRKPHPCVKIAQDARTMFCRALRELDLDVSPPAAGKRPPALRSNRRAE
jgi:phage terminase small subunit